VAEGAELACSRDVTVDRILKETLATVDRDVLQLVQVSPKTERTSFYVSFSIPFLGSLTFSLFQLSMQCLAWDATEEAELQEEVTWV
jgi:hypothetical protein